MNKNHFFGDSIQDHFRYETKLLNITDFKEHAHIYISGWHITSSYNKFEKLTSKKFGGAIMLVDKGVFRDLYSELFHNMAVKGGAIAVSANSELFLEKTTVERNYGIHGGAIYIDQGSFLRASFVTIEHNWAQEYGGFLVAFTQSSFTISNSFISKNRASLKAGYIGEGSAIYGHGLS